MALMKKSNGGLATFRSMLTDFFEPEEMIFDRLWKKEFIPAVNISEVDKNYEIEMAAPGWNKEDFKVKVENGILNISAEKKEEKEEKNKNYTRQEYKFSSFNRSFTLPDDAKEEDIKAQYENGVLKLTVGKKQTATTKAKEIAVA